MNRSDRVLRTSRLGRRVCALLPGLASLALLSACAGGLPLFADAMQPASGAATATARLRPLGPFADLSGPVMSPASTSAMPAVSRAGASAASLPSSERETAGLGSAASPASVRAADPAAGAIDPLLRTVLASSCPQAAAQPRSATLGAGAAAGALRRDRGFLWRIERDGRASYLYGTLHFGKPEWMVPGPTVQAALDSTNLLALEMDPFHEPADLRVPTRALSKPATTEAVLRGPALPAPLQQRLDQQARAVCVVPDEWAARTLPQQLHVLSVLAARPDGLEPAYAQEVSLSQSVRAARRPVLPLETVQEQRRALQLEGKETVEAQADRVLAQLESGSLRRTLTRISTVWERGDLDDLERYESWCDCVPRAAERQDLRRINDERNALMAARIAALHAQGHRVFAAVGAMHMVGTQGLPQQMAALGFQVERVLWSSPFERTAGRF